MSDREDCYFWIDNQPGKEPTIEPMCLECHKKRPDLGWFWAGSRLGYGPWNYICALCGHVVYAGEKTGEPMTNENDTTSV